MTNQCGGLATEQEPAAERIEEAKRLYATIKWTIEGVIDDLKTGNPAEVRLLKTEVARLNEVLQSIQKREQEFDEQFGESTAGNGIDLEQARTQIGCRLARLRRCCDGG